MVVIVVALSVVPIVKHVKIMLLIIMIIVTHLSANSNLMHIGMIILIIMHIIMHCVKPVTVHICILA